MNFNARSPITLAAAALALIVFVAFAIPALASTDDGRFLVRDGTRAMSGNLDMDGNNIIDIGNIDFVTFTADTGTIAALTAATADINGGTIDGSTIGGSSAAAGTFTTVTASGAIAANAAAGITTTQTTFPLVNATATTVNFAGAATTLNIAAAASSTTWTGQAWTLTGGNSTANTTLTVTNTSNAAASQSIVDVRVGGTTSTGDPQYRLTVPGGTSRYIGLDNSVAGDPLFIGTGTTVGASDYELRIINSAGSAFFTLQTQNQTPAGGSALAGSYGARLTGRSLTITDAVQTTGVVANFNVLAVNLAQSGGAVTVDKFAGIASIGATAGASVTLTHSSAFRALTGGAAVNVSGLYIEPQTAGTTRNVQILLENGSTEPSGAPANTTGIYGIDLGSATVLGVVAETAAVSTGDAPATHKIIIRYNGTSYALLATTTLTGE